MLTTRDILTGFLRNYGSLKIDIEGTLTSWTFKSMSYFNELGKLLGFWVELEGHRYDQIWFKFDPRSKFYNEKNMFLHIEHENNETRIDQTIEKIVGDSDKPKAKKRIAIVYPKGKSLTDEVRDFSKRTVNLTSKNEEVSVLFLGLNQSQDDNGYWAAEIVRKYISKDEIKTRNYKFRMKLNENEILYTVFKD